MSNRLFSIAKKNLLTGVSGCNLNADIRMALLMTNTTVDTENDGIENLGDFTTLDECNGANYARRALSTATPTVAIDTARDSVKLSCASHPVFPNLGAGSRSIAGVLFYFNILDDDNQSVPFLYCPYTTPRNPDGGNFTVELPADKVLIEFFQAAVGTDPVTL